MTALYGAAGCMVRHLERDKGIGMFDKILQSSTIPVLEQVVQFTEARHTVLAGNLANLQTPGYRARDLSVADFQARLKAALEEQQKPSAMARPSQGEQARSPGEAAAAGNRRSLATVAEDSKGIVYHDGTNISMEQQATEMAKNQMQHNLALAIMISQFGLLDTAISERV